MAHDARTRTPAMPLYASSWLKATAAMPAASRGYYIDLLLWMWDQDRPLPDDSRAQMQISRCTSRREWTRVWRDLEPLFEWTEDGYTSPKLEEVRAQVARFRKAQSLKGQASAAKRAERKQATPVATVAQPWQQPEAAPSQIPEGQPEPQPKVNFLSSNLDHEDQEDQRAEPAPRAILDMEPKVRVLIRLAHDVLDARDAGVVADPDVPEELKSRAAMASLPYNGTAIRKALEAAEWQRARRQQLSPEEAASAPDAPTEPADGAIWLLERILRQHPDRRMPWTLLAREVYAAAARAWPDDPDHRTRVIQMAWRKDTIRLAPHLELVDDDVRYQ